MLFRKSLPEPGSESVLPPFLPEVSVLTLRSMIYTVNIFISWFIVVPSPPERPPDTIGPESAVHPSLLEGPSAISLLAEKDEVWDPE